VLAGVEEGVGGGLVLLDVHARERLEDAAEQHLHVAVVAGEVLVMTSPSSTATRSAGGT
jgi:hypothetical protein